MTTEQEERMLELEERKVKALEDLSESVNALTTWFEQINKEDWSNRIQFYLSEWKKSLER